MKWKYSLLFLGLVLVLTTAAGIACAEDREKGIQQALPDDCRYPCESWKIGNMVCHQECNNAECNWDGGDCSEPTTAPTAKPTAKSTSTPISTSILTPTPTIAQCADYCFITWIGDGQCDFACYNAECNWDGGDCGTSTAAPTAKPTATPTNAMSGYCSDRCMWEWVGDGQCDYEWHCYTATCNWDSGDCRTYYNECSLGCPAAQVGNGTCEPTCNNAACGYDEGDCN